MGGLKLRKGELIMVYVIISGILFVAWLTWLIFFDRGKCIYCHKERWIPFGAEHLLCAFANHPRRAMMGWYLLFMGILTRKESYRRKEKWLKNITKHEGYIIIPIF